MTALHTFFAQSLPMLQVSGDATVTIVHDNAKGLSKANAVSERRRKYEAHFVSPSTGHSKGKMSRWESEMPALVTISNSPCAAQRQTRVREADATAPEAVVAPQIPRRRVSVEDDCRFSRNEAEETSHSRGSQNSNSSRSTRSEGSQRSVDSPLAPPRRRISCLAWLDQVEANDLSVVANDESGQVSETRLQPQSMKSFTGDIVLSMRDARISCLNDSAKTSSSNKSAPRRPRRMKSMDLNDLTPQPHHDHHLRVANGKSSLRADQESSLRLALSGSIDSVMQQVKNQTSADREPVPIHKLSSSEQIALKDAVRGVVGALNRRSSSRRNIHENDFDASGKKNSKGSKGSSPNRQRRESSPRTGE